jgi:hypothetical protein
VLVPDAVPVAPVAAFAHFTLLTLTLSAAVPATVSGDPVAVHVGTVVGEVIVIVGGVVSRAANAGSVIAPATNTIPQRRPAALLMRSPRCAWLVAKERPTKWPLIVPEFMAHDR